VDNEFFVPHGYLSDEEAGEDEQDETFNPETAKEKLRLKEKEFQAEHKKTTHQLKPRLTKETEDKFIPMLVYVWYSV
jgi:chromatin assembly factor 1 subunit A